MSNGGDQVQIPKWLFNVVIAVLIAFLGWWLKGLYGDFRELNKKHGDDMKSVDLRFDGHEKEMDGRIDKLEQHQRLSEGSMAAMEKLLPREVFEAEQARLHEKLDRIERAVIEGGD